jgi:hypothetical protein
MRQPARLRCRHRGRSRLERVSVAEDLLRLLVDRHEWVSALARGLACRVDLILRVDLGSKSVTGLL